MSDLLHAVYLSKFNAKILLCTEHRLSYVKKECVAGDEIIFMVNTPKAKEHLPSLDYSLHIIQLTSFGFSAGHLVQNHRRNIMKLCVINRESTPFVCHIGFSVVKKKASNHSVASNVHDFWPCLIL